MVCGIDTCLTRLVIGTDCAGAASTGGVSMVVTASNAILLNLVIGLNSPANFRAKDGSLTAASRRATAAPQQSGFFDQRRVDVRNSRHLAIRAMNQRSLLPASTVALSARWWRWQWDSAGATGWRWRKG